MTDAAIVVDHVGIKFALGRRRKIGVKDFLIQGPESVGNR